MKIFMDDSEKIMEIWLLHEDTFGELPSEIEKQIKEYRNQKYTVVVYRSGREDLLEQTRQLLLRNNSNTIG